MILALDLYVRLGRRVPDDHEPEVIALSELPNALPIHIDRPDHQRFRNPNGVALKLANFRALDQPGHGMSRGGRGDRAVWEEFSNDSDGLRRTAAAILAGYASQRLLQPRTTRKRSFLSSHLVSAVFLGFAQRCVEDEMVSLGAAASNHFSGQRSPHIPPTRLSTRTPLHAVIYANFDGF